MPETIWYYARGEVEMGPISTPQIKSLVAAGGLRRDDLVWNDGMSDWMQAGKVAELFSSGTKSGGEVDTNADASAGKPNWGRPKPPLLASSDWQPVVGGICRGVCAVAVLLMVASRGCDSLSDYEARRLAFELETAADQVLMLVEEQTRLRDALTTAESRARLAVLDQELTAAISRRDQTRGQTAQARQDLIRTSRWRRIAFLLGAVISGAGALVLAAVGTQQERLAGFAVAGFAALAVILA